VVVFELELPKHTDAYQPRLSPLSVVPSQRLAPSVFSPLSRSNSLHFIYIVFVAVQLSKIPSSFRSILSQR
jgi:hypothetical protein